MSIGNTLIRLSIADRHQSITLERNISFVFIFVINLCIYLFDIFANAIKLKHRCFSVEIVYALDVVLFSMS